MTSKNIFFYPWFVGLVAPDSGFGFFCVRAQNQDTKQTSKNLQVRDVAWRGAALRGAVETKTGPRPRTESYCGGATAALRLGRA